MTSKGGPWGAAGGPGGASAGATANPYHHQGPNPFHQGAAPGTNSDWWHSSSFTLVILQFKIDYPFTGDYLFLNHFQVEEARHLINRHQSEELGVASRHLTNTATDHTPIYLI